MVLPHIVWNRGLDPACPACEICMLSPGSTALLPHSQDTRLGETAPVKLPILCDCVCAYDSVASYTRRFLALCLCFAEQAPGLFQISWQKMDGLY